MKFWIGVKNFAKIESAKINVDSYTLLVGQNNSGKTFLMQLVQGLRNKIANLIDESIFSILSGENENGYMKCVISNDNMPLLIDYINGRLYEEKERIVKEIFGKSIPIEELYVDIVFEGNIQYELILADADIKEEQLRDIAGLNLSSFIRGVISKLNGKRRIGILFKKNLESGEDTLYACVIGGESKRNLIAELLSTILNFESLFLPASRTGLFLLYRDFFANRTDDAIAYRFVKDQPVEDKEEYGKLTQPVYEFLRFLQTYSENDDAKQIYKKELNFFESNLIEGHIRVNKQGMFSYSSQNDAAGIPMYLASSMINEVVPIVLAVTGSKGYQRLIIDEVEASLHPEKQLEMVRFLNRLNNRGMRLIVSTHSDTFVNRMNNLYVLSQYVRNSDGDIMDKFGLERDDLVDPRRMFVYEFVNQPNGKSIVKEIIADPKTGYQFDLFTDSAMRIYDEALKLGEIQQNDLC